jgi:non-specific protein-tyrosine kinase
MANTPVRHPDAVPDSVDSAPTSVSQPFNEQQSMNEGVAQLQFADLPVIELPKNQDNPVLVLGGGPSAVLDSYKSLRTRLIRLRGSRALNSVVITSASQADGKTITAYNLACCTAQLEDTPVLLIDADLRTHALTSLIGALPPTGLAEVLRGTATYAEALVRTDLPNLFVMGAGNGDTESAELLSTDRWEQFMHWANTTFKLVLVDSLPVGLVSDFDLIAGACDGVMMVVRAFATSRAVLEAAVGQIDPKKMLGVVWNAAPPVSKENYYAAQSTNGR